MQLLCVSWPIFLSNLCVWSWRGCKSLSYIKAERENLFMFIMFYFEFEKSWYMVYSDEQYLLNWIFSFLLCTHRRHFRRFRTLFSLKRSIVVELCSFILLLCCYFKISLLLNLPCLYLGLIEYKQTYCFYKIRENTFEAIWINDAAIIRNQSYRDASSS